MGKILTRMNLDGIASEINPNCELTKQVVRMVYNKGGMPLVEEYVKTFKPQKKRYKPMKVFYRVNSGWQICLPHITLSKATGSFWFRVFGYGLVINNRTVNAPLFSDRNGLVKVCIVGKWSIKFLKPNMI